MAFIRDAVGISFGFDARKTQAPEQCTDFVLLANCQFVISAVGMEVYTDAADVPQTGRKSLRKFEIHEAIVIASGEQDFFTSRSGAFESSHAKPESAMRKGRALITPGAARSTHNEASDR
ncbi:hypothetical protein RRG08_019652 [Elysia crispata]|uniref:Uncharacterized protein n=1 Tax=Elysia crispata TaxID=231223 RepID=A0AAE1E8C2_9GAST|nr:hypothetical protein RRG08_019652 [Elysia crispata]